MLLVWTSSDAYSETRKYGSEVAQSCPTLFDPMDCSLSGSSVHGIFQARVDCHFLLQGIFPTQESNPGLPHCRQTLYRLSHLGSSETRIYVQMVHLRSAEITDTNYGSETREGKEPIMLWATRIYSIRVRELKYTNSISST